jgi:hypothetical protein
MNTWLLLGLAAAGGVGVYLVTRTASTPPAAGGLPGFGSCGQPFCRDLLQRIGADSNFPLYCSDVGVRPGGVPLPRTSPVCQSGCYLNGDMTTCLAEPTTTVRQTPAVAVVQTPFALPVWADDFVPGLRSMRRGPTTRAGGHGGRRGHH